MFFENARWIPNIGCISKYLPSITKIKPSIIKIKPSQNNIKPSQNNMKPSQNSTIPISLKNIRGLHSTKHDKNKT